MQVFSHRLVDGQPLNVGYYLTGNKDAKVDSTTEIEGVTVFQAAEQGSMPLVSTFLLGGVDPNVNERDGKRATPLHYAAKSGEQMLLRFLLDNGAHVDATSGSGETPLMWAVEANHPDIVPRVIYELGVSGARVVWCVCLATERRKACARRRADEDCRRE